MIVCIILEAMQRLCETERASFSEKEEEGYKKKISHFLFCKLYFYNFKCSLQ